MNECFKCGVSGEQKRLFDVISDDGIVKICEKCFLEESLPIVHKPEKFDFKEVEQKQTVYERLSRVAGIDKSKEVKPEDENLREIVEENFNKNVFKNKNKRDDLVDNFHWILMRARRAKKLTQEQFARGIGESVSAVKFAEQGIIPDGNLNFIEKLENNLGVKILKKDFSFSNNSKKEIRFDKNNPQFLTIEDLKKMRQEKESEILDKDVPVFVEDSEEKDLSEDDVSDIVFRR